MLNALHATAPARASLDAMVLAMRSSRPDRAQDRSEVAIGASVAPRTTLARTEARAVPASRSPPGPHMLLLRWRNGQRTAHKAKPVAAGSSRQTLGDPGGRRRH